MPPMASMRAARPNGLSPASSRDSTGLPGKQLMQGDLLRFPHYQAGDLPRTVMRLVRTGITITISGKKPCVDFCRDQAENAAAKRGGTGEGVAAAAPSSGEVWRAVEEVRSEYATQPRRGRFT